MSSVGGSEGVRAAKPRWVAAKAAREEGGHCNSVQESIVPIPAKSTSVPVIHQPTDPILDFHGQL